MAGRHLLTKTLAVLLLIIAVADSIRARVIIGGLSFQQMFEKADLVVIATVRKTKDTSERKNLSMLTLMLATRCHPTSSRMK
jgi:hypothetical protein